MVVLYSTGCPKCNVLEGRLKKNNINFKVSYNIDKLIEMGFQSAPILKVNDNYFDFGRAMNMLKSYERGMTNELGGAE